MTDKKKKTDPRKTALELELKELEVEKARAELGFLLEDRGIKEDEAREKSASAAKAEIDLELRKLDSIRVHHQHALLADAHAGVFRIEESVRDEVLQLAAAMQRWGDQHPGDPVVLYIFSPGGSVLHGFALYDTLRTLSDQGHEVTTVIRGFAGSMASVIFLAGDIRKIGAESIVHQHEPSTIIYGKMSENADAAKFTERLYEKITRIYTTRANLTRTRFRSLTLKKEWYADAEEALRVGVATVVE